MEKEDVMKKGVSCSDEHLVGLAQNGDVTACNLLLERCRFKINQTIYFNINDRTLVNDLTQEVLLKVYRYLNYFNEESQFSTWLYRITQNTLKNHFRSVSLRLDSEAQFVDEQSEYHSQSPEHVAMNMEFNNRVVDEIAKLSNELRTCYGMHIFEGRSYEDIAKKMHCPIGTVRSRIFRARKLLMSSVKLALHEN